MKRVIEAMSALIEDRAPVAELFRLASIYSTIHSGLKPQFYEWLYKEILQASRAIQLEASKLRARLAPHHVFFL